MGNNPSQPENIAPNYQLMRDEAMKIFNLRVKSYSYAHHGAYNEYVDYYYTKSNNNINSNGPK